MPTTQPRYGIFGRPYGRMAPRVEATLTAVRNATADLVRAWWADMGPDDSVESKYSFRIDAKSHKGRKVYAVAAAEESPGPADRGADVYDYRVALVTVERFEPAGDVPEEWIDERVRFTEFMWKFVGEAREIRLLGDPAIAGSELFPKAAAVTTVYDFEELTERKLFISVVEVTYTEDS